MAENTAAGTDQTVNIRPSAQSEQTVAIQPAAASEQTVNIQPVAATEQTIAILAPEQPVAVPAPAQAAQPELTAPATPTEPAAQAEPAAQTDQTMNIQAATRAGDAGVAVPADAPAQTTPAEVARLKAVGTARVAIRGKAVVKAIEAAPIALQTPEALPGFEELASTWWCAVAKVHEALLSEAELQAVCEAFDTELRARWEYARTLHQEGYEVPEYLTERALVAPLWPLPPLPELAADLAHAA